MSPIFGKSGALILAGGLALAPFVLSPPAEAQRTPQPASYTAAQATQGKIDFDRVCASCHGADLSGAGPAVALAGPTFLAKYGGKSIETLLTAVRRMPPGAPDSIDANTRANIIAYMLQANGVAAGQRALSSIPEALTTTNFPGGGVAAPAPTPINLTPRPGPSQLDKLRPVTEADLDKPPASDWLNWRGTRDALGYSPLKQIDRSNVKNLKTAFVWALSPGGNMMTPIVRDGVIFSYSFGDIVEALDGTNGQILWRYQRQLDPGGSFTGKKGVAIAGDKIIVPTSDCHIIALNIKTGAVMWDLKIDTKGQAGSQIKSSPLIVGNKAIIGTNGYADVLGGNFLLAVDLDTGKEAWRFNTLARPGEPGGDTWNDLPLDQRSGGSVWEAVSYDPQTKLIYFGTAPTYATSPLRVPVKKPGVTSDALYTNATIALHVDTGKLAWYYQHTANDQLDHDWVFERQLLDVNVDGVKRRVVLTAGKLAIYEALDATTGKYLFSWDLGFQNVITAIDPKTGAKTISPAAFPSPTQQLVGFRLPGICPDALGARNMMSASFSPQTKLLYLPITDTCLLDGKRWQKNPDPSTDGQFGLMQALDLNTRKVVWSRRDAAPPASGNLSTAGGLLFTGDSDRWFRALDERTGKELWKVRLDSALESYPVAYSVNGKQYVAVATNEGWAKQRTMRRIANIFLPNPSATLWVFALPD